MPMFPFASTVKSETPDDDATLNGLTEGEPCTFKVNDDDVAFTPATVPLSKKSPVERVLPPVKRARNPLFPPVTPEIPRDDVATQRVDVPVDQST